MKTKYIEVSHVEGKLEAYSFKDTEFDTEINVGMFSDGSGIILQDLFEEDNPREIVIDVNDIEKFRTILRYALEKCKSKAKAAQGDLND